MIQLETIYQRGVEKWGHSPTDFTDKGIDHDYLGFYHQKFYFTRYDIRLLEIGISSGGSAWLWSQYFVNSDIHAVDIAPNFHTPREFQEEIVKNPNVHLHWNFDSRKTLSYLRVPGQFDYIIDDGDHTPAAQIETFRHAYPSLKPKGIYFIEDCQTLEQAKMIQAHIKLLEPSTDPQLYIGQRHPQRQDDLIVWIQKC